MGVITAGNSNIFKPATFIYSKVRRFLKSFDAANLIDEGEFPTYTKEVLKLLGIGAYKESKALVKINKYKGELPHDFEYLYSAYKCTPFTYDTNKTPNKHLQNSSFGFSTEITKTYFETNGCEIDCCEQSIECIESISVKNYVTDGLETIDFRNIIPLRLSPNVSNDVCMNDCRDLFRSSKYEIGIDGKEISTNFTDDYVYIKYYAFPITEEGDILIPNTETVERTIEWYIIYQILLSGWYNSSIPDIQNKAKDAEMRYNSYFSEAKYFNKLPSFAEMVNTIRTRKGLNKTVYFTDQMSNTNFQRSI